MMICEVQLLVYRYRPNWAAWSCDAAIRDASVGRRRHRRLTARRWH